MMLAMGLDYNTPLPEARKILTNAASSVEEVLSEPAIEVDIVGFGGSSIDFVIRYWTRPQKATVRRTQTQVIMAVKAACDQANLNIPYPIRTVYFFDQKNFDDASAMASRDGSTLHQSAEA